MSARRRTRRFIWLLLLALSGGLTWAATTASDALSHVAAAVVALFGFILLLWPLAGRLQDWLLRRQAQLASKTRRARARAAGTIAPSGTDIAVTTASQVQIRGRSELIDEIVLRIERDRNGAWCCYGFMGIGKSTVLTEVVRAVRERLPAETVRYGCYPRGPTKPSFAQVLAGLLPRGAVTASDDWQRLEELAGELDNNVVLLDEFPYDDETAIGQLAWLLATLRSRSTKCFFVLAAQERPTLSSDVECHELLGIDLSEFRPYCAELGALFEQPEFSDSQICALHAKTQGNPQLARLAIAAGAFDSEGQEVLEATIEGRVWAVTTTEQRVALRTLAALHKLEAEIPEPELAAIVEDWSDVRVALVKRSLNVTAAPGRFKIHDLVNTYVRRHDDELVRREHCRLTHHYQSSPFFDSDLRLAGLAAGHCAASRDPAIMAEFYLKIAERLRTAGAASQLRGLTESAMLLRTRLPALISDAVRADLGWSLGHFGETAEAVDVLSKLLSEIESRGSDIDHLQRARLIRQIADCRRLRGEVVQAEHDLSNAVRDLRSRGLGKTTESLACQLDHAHCGYLAARPQDSLERLLNIRAACEQTPFASEWCYRLSKAQRLLWNLEHALTAAHDCRSLAVEAGNELSNVKGSWAELATARLNTRPDDRVRIGDLIDKCLEVEQRFGELGYRAAVFVKHDIADLLRTSGAHKEAADEFRRVRGLTAAMGETNREAHSWLGEAECIRAADGRIGSVGDADHLSRYEQARVRYEAMDNVWGIAISRFGQVVAEGSAAMDAAAELLRDPCCQGEQGLVASGTVLFPLNFV